MSNSTQDTEDVVLVRLLEALAGDCENTDGWEAAAPDIRKAAQRIQSLSDRIDVLEAAAEGMIAANSAARAMVPDEEEGLAAQVFAYHINAGDMELALLYLTYPPPH